jgi:hypothetical protein
MEVDAAGLYLDTRMTGGSLTGKFPIIGGGGPGGAFDYWKWLGLGSAAVTLTGDDPLTPSRKLDFPERKRNVWTCRCRADCNDNIPGNCPEDPLKRFAFGNGTGSSFGEAVKAGKKAATDALNCQPKHIPCACTGPNGEQRRTRK